MNNIKACRVCGSDNTYQFNLSLPRLLSPYLYRSNNWHNRFCQDCMAVSHYPKEAKNLVKYADSSYRKEQSNARPQSPISLPWSTITSLRSKHISKLLKGTEKFLDIIKDKSISLLDYGGYNGFTSYGLKSYLDINRIIIADLDPNGLSIASALDMETVNLSKYKANEYTKEDIDLCVCVQVLEHLEKPSKQLLHIISKNCSKISEKEKEILLDYLIMGIYRGKFGSALSGFLK